MKTLFYSIKDFETSYLQSANNSGLPVAFEEKPLSPETAALANGYNCISVFTGDDVSEEVLGILHASGVRCIAVRAAGYDNVNLEAARRLGIQVANVPAYSPYAIAEHTTALMLALNRKLILAHQQGQAFNFTLRNLIGFDFHGKTVGILGTGKIGSIVAGILHGFGCKILAFDAKQSQELIAKVPVTYTDLATIYREADIISVHLPLNKETRYILDKNAFAAMKKGVLLVNTSRGAVVNTSEMLPFLENGQVGYYGADVYDREKGVFFFNRSATGCNDPVLEQLLQMPNVLITPHQGFATHEALTNIAATTFYNINTWNNGEQSSNELAMQ